MYLKTLIFNILDDNNNKIVNDMNTRVESKISLLNDTQIKFFGSDLYLARIKFIGLFVKALSKFQTVNIEKLAGTF